MKVCDTTAAVDLCSTKSSAAILIFYSAYCLFFLFVSTILLAFGIEIDLLPVISSIILSATVIAVVSLLYVVVTNGKKYPCAVNDMS